MLELTWNGQNEYTRQHPDYTLDCPKGDRLPFDPSLPHPRNPWFTFASRDWNGSGQSGTGQNGAGSGWNGSGQNGHGWGGGLKN
jgi:hypothetical protein